MIVVYVESNMNKSENGKVLSRTILNKVHLKLTRKMFCLFRFHHHCQGLCIKLELTEKWAGKHEAGLYVTLVTMLCTPSLDLYLDTPCWFQVGPSFAFSTVLIFHGIDSSQDSGKYAENSSEILVHSDTSASRI